MDTRSKASSLGLLPMPLFAIPAEHSPQPAAGSARKVEVDVPVTLSKGDVVFNIGRLAFTGDLPFGVKYMNLLSRRLADAKVAARIIGVFHGPSAYLILDDRAYNESRKVTTGNPYKEMLAELLQRGVQLEMCAVSMDGNNWSNDDLLPRVRVTTSGLLRVIELVQQGFVQIQP